MVPVPQHRIVYTDGEKKWHWLYEEDEWSILAQPPNTPYTTASAPSAKRKRAPPPPAAQGGTARAATSASSAAVAPEGDAALDRRRGDENAGAGGAAAGGGDFFLESMRGAALVGSRLRVKRYEEWASWQVEQ